MKLIGLKEAKSRLSEFVDAAQRDRILITRRGVPAALVIGVQGQDIEQVVLGNDAEFWRMIQERRKRTNRTMTSDEIRRSFSLNTASDRNRLRRKKAKPKKQH